MLGRGKGFLKERIISTQKCKKRDFPGGMMTIHPQVLKVVPPKNKKFLLHNHNLIIIVKKFDIDTMILPNI